MPDQTPPEPRPLEPPCRHPKCYGMPDAPVHTTTPYTCPLRKEDEAMCRWPTEHHSYVEASRA